MTMSDAELRQRWDASNREDNKLIKSITVYLPCAPDGVELHSGLFKLNAKGDCAEKWVEIEIINCPRCEFRHEIEMDIGAVTTWGGGVKGSTTWRKETDRT